MKSMPTVDSALAQSLEWMDAGASRDECLAGFPEFADAIAPLLDAAQFARASLMAGEQLPAPNLARSRARFLDAARPARVGIFAPRLALATVLAILLLIVSGIGLSTASADALPGDTLYPIKLGFEQTQLALTFNADARTQLEEDHAARRRDEVQAVITMQRETNVEFSGVVQSASGGVLIVSGVPLVVEDETDLPVGSPVQIQARTTNDGRVIARRIAQPTRTPPPGEPHPTITFVLTETRLPPPPTFTLRPIETRILIPPSREIPPTETRRPPFATLAPRASLPAMTAAPPRETGTRPASFPTPPIDPRGTRTGTRLPTPSRASQTPIPIGTPLPPPPGVRSPAPSRPPITSFPIGTRLPPPPGLTPSNVLPHPPTRK